MTKFNNVELTPETLEQTKQSFIDGCKDCIREAESGEVFVNDLEDYTAWRLSQIRSYENDENSHTFTFLQRAYYIQTGESVALLP